MIKSIDQNDLISNNTPAETVENGEVKFTIIERIEKYTKRKRITEKKKEDEWTENLRTNGPFGFKMKLNHPTKKE